MNKYVTTDPYYDVAFFNESKEALRNNKIDFNLLIQIKPPFSWVFELSQFPTMVNYDEITKTEKRWLIRTVQPLTTSDEYLFLRRSADKGKKALLKFTENEPLKLARESNFAVFFHVKNRQTVEDLTKLFPGKIWFLGKYYNDKYNVCLCTHSAIKNLLDPDVVLLEKTDNEPGRFESDLNWFVFKGNDTLVKFTQTPYFEDGKMHRVNIQGEHSHRFTL